MAEKRAAAKQADTKPRRRASAKRKANARKKAPRKKLVKQAAKRTKIVFDEWDSYVGRCDGATMFISFDDLVTRGEPPADLRFCARILVPIHAPNEVGGPASPETERLWNMEDELCSMLRKHKVRCRLVARLTHRGRREIVFQLHDWESFRPPVGLWMMKHEDYEIDVSEHEGWDFFDECVRPTEEDRLFMADRSVIEALIENGSDPAKKHALEYAFQGDVKGLRRVAKALLKRGYKPLGKLDYDSGMIELTKRLALDLSAVAEESINNHRVSRKAGVEFLGWGATAVD